MNQPESTALRRRDNILSAVSFAASVFLQSSGWREALDTALQRLGEAAQANRAYVFQNHLRGSDGAILTSQLAEWVAPGVEPQLENPDLQNFPFVENGFGRWLELLSDRKPVYGLVSSFPEGERELFESQQIQSLVLMPVFSQQRLWGFLGFDDCEQLREWSVAETDALFAASTALGAAIDRSNLESQLRFAQKMEAVGSLAAGVAHDFNNMLQAIDAFTRIAKSKIQDDHTAQTDLDEVLMASGRAHQLTRQLLSFSHKQESNPTNLSLSDVCESIITMVRPLLGGSVDLATDIIRPSPVVYADSEMVSQMLLNVCLNANDAMPNGGRLEVTCSSCVVTPSQVESIEGVDPGPFARLTIRDTGSGMTREIQDRIFEPFFTTKSIGRGTGLGLSVAYGEIQKIGGFIEVESSPDEGSEFRIFLPLIDEPREDERCIDEPREDERCKMTRCEDERCEDERCKDPTRPAPAIGAETILLVDDEPAVLASFKQLIESAGYHVLTATNGAHGLKVFRDHVDEIQLILTDSVMPELDGLGLIEAVIESDPEAKIILLSGYPPTLPPGAIEWRNVRHMQKPIGGDILHNAIRELLDRNAVRFR